MMTEITTPESEKCEITLIQPWGHYDWFGSYRPSKYPKIIHITIEKTSLSIVESQEGKKPPDLFNKGYSKKISRFIRNDLSYIIFVKDDDGFNEPVLHFEIYEDTVSVKLIFEKWRPRVSMTYYENPEKDKILNALNLAYEQYKRFEDLVVA